MSATGQAFVTITDGASQVAVPANSVQAVIGCAAGGTNYQIVATQNPQTLLSTFTGGPLPEASALTCLAGGTVLAVKVPTANPGVASAVVHTGSGASVCTVTLDGTTGAFDDYNVKVLVVTGGTVGTAGCIIQVSLDAGRNYGPIIALGTATTYVIANSGITLNFTVATLIAGDTYTFGTTGPKWADSAIQTALNTLAGSQYGVVGWGSTHIVGNCTNAAAVTGGVPAADVTTIEGYLDTLATGFDYTRTFLSARDASKPTAYGGTAESETTWINAVNADFSTASCKRVCAGAANWNMPSAYPNASAGSPRYRRNIAWAAAARKVAVPIQRHLGRVKDGALAQIAVDAANDPLDGFIYHDESQNGGLDYVFTGTGGRMMTTTTRKGRPGVFITNNLLLSPLGSDFWLESLGTVMDTACAIVHQVGDQFINEDLRTNANGTIDKVDASFLEASFRDALNSLMVAVGALTAITAVVDRTTNVHATGTVNVTITLRSKAYVLKEVISIGFASTGSAS